MTRRDETVKALEAQYVCTFRREPEGGYTVTCPALPEVVTYGATLPEARKMAQEAIEVVLEVYQADGREIPPGDGDALETIQEPVSVKLARA
jgi:predicted RNase H-like HicB family nuclease